FFFFFQAEDGIRDKLVTGVQTCALPILLHAGGRVGVLREKQNPEVLAYLEAENAYTAAGMKHTEALQEQLYREMLGRIKETDLTVPYRNNGYWYYNRTEQGKPYPIYCRKKGSLDAAEDVILDQNALAQGKRFHALGG